MHAAKTIRLSFFELNLHGFTNWTRRKALWQPKRRSLLVFPSMPCHTKPHGSSEPSVNYPFSVALNGRNWFLFPRRRWQIKLLSIPVTNTTSALTIENPKQPLVFESSSFYRFLISFLVHQRSVISISCCHFIFSFISAAFIIPAFYPSIW